MNRRDMMKELAAVTLVGVPKIETDSVNACRDRIDLSMLVRMWAKTARFEMHPAQWSVYSMMIAGVSGEEYSVALGMCGALPISVNPDVPKDEVRLVAFDGTIMSRLTGLAIPIGL